MNLKMYLLVYALISFHIIHEIASNPAAPIVQTPLGIIAGSYKQSYSGRKYEAYFGVPYAKPPVGLLRFESPKPVDKWNNVFHATQKPSPCIQYKTAIGSYNSGVRGKEDCLYLNIYVPVHAKKKLLPVLVYIYGGGFYMGSALNSANFLMDRDVIVVSMNYRLGIFGFLSTQDHHITGNMGLKDQSMALRWTSGNIHSFGGDPKKITLFGNSAGGLCVHFHYLSPMSKGLFQNGISFSGTALTLGGIQKNPLKKFKDLVNIVNCSRGSIAKNVECLRTKPASQIAEATKEFAGWFGLMRIPFSPVVEKDALKPFIDRSPIDIIKNGDIANVPWVTSILKDEGLIPGIEIIKEPTYLEQLDRNWNIIAPDLLIYYMPDAYYNHYSDLIRKKYFGNQKITKKNAKALISLLTDRIYRYYIRSAAKLHAKANKSTVLFLYYSYRARTSYSDSFVKGHENFGVAHTDDINMIIDNPFIFPPNDTEDRAVQVKLIDLVVSMAEKGYPDIGQQVEWEKVDSSTETLKFLHFANSKNIYMEKDNFLYHQLWDEVNTAELNFLSKI